MRLYHRVLSVAAGVAMGLAACAGPGPGTSGNASAPIHLYGSDGVMQDTLGAALADPAVLAGMKGTAPLNPLPTDFTNRLLEIDSSLTGFRYAGETYDAVVISALAAELAGTPDPAVVREYITGVTTDGEPCPTLPGCLELARDGQQVRYRGVSVQSGFTDRGEPAMATYATLHFGADGVIDQAKTEYVGAGDLSAVTEAEPPAPGPRPDGPASQLEPLRFGGLLPASGSLAAGFHAPMAAAAQLAVAEINDAGGVFGVDVRWEDGDGGSFEPDLAGETIDDHVEEGVHVLIGPAASETVAAVLPQAVAAGRILFSPSGTRADLTGAAHDGYFFRTAPPDHLQGVALADVVLRDGADRVVVIAENGGYGLGLQEIVYDSLHRYGIPEADLIRLTYPPPPAGELPAAEVGPLVERIAEVGPDAVVLIGFGEAAGIVQAMIDAGLPVG